MIEVTLFTPAGRDAIEANTPEDAISAARLIYDEARDANPFQGFTAAMTTTFAVGGQVVRIFEGVRP